MKYYPVLLDLKGKKCLVVGAGGVAERKVRYLLKAKAAISILSPGLNPGLKRLKDKKAVSWIPSGYKEAFLKDAFLVIAATSDKKINSQISQNALKSGILINVVDDPGISNFIVPSNITKGGLTISISTAGAAPGLSKRIRKDLTKLLVPEYAKFLKLLAVLREELKQKCSDPKLRSKILNALCASKPLG